MSESEGVNKCCFAYMNILCVPEQSDSKVDGTVYELHAYMVGIRSICYQDVLEMCLLPKRELSKVGIVRGAMRNVVEEKIDVSIVLCCHKPVFACLLTHYERPLQ